MKKITILILATLTLAQLSWADKVVKAVDQNQAQKCQESCRLAATPGENHRVLDAFVGQWKHTVKYFMPGQADPMVSQGTTENKWILDGKFLQDTTHGTSMGQPFEGIGTTGYDNLAKEYKMVWQDNMTTGMMIASGQYDAQKKAINEQGTFSCPMSGEQGKKFRAIWQIVDQDHYTYTFFTNGPDGQEVKMMEIAYERVK